MVRLILFSGSQSPLPVRYARPSKPALAIPPLVHRALHTALDAQPPSALFDNSADTLVIPNPSAFVKHTSGSDKEYEVTVKIQVSAAATPSSYYQNVKSALQVLADRKGLAAADIVLVGLPDGTSHATWVDFWKSLADIPNVQQWGTLNLLEPTLSKLSDIRVPFANELNVSDCEKLPKEYITFAAAKGIQVWASGGKIGSDPLPAADLHNLLQEFQPVVAELAPLANTLSLTSPIGCQDDAFDASAKTGVSVNWVLSYTLLSRTRNIVKDKGYIIAAELV